MVLHQRDQQPDRPDSRRSAAPPDDPSLRILQDSETLEIDVGSAPTFSRMTIPPPTDADWESLQQYLEAFCNAWSAEAIPSIAEHLPSHPPSLRRLTLVELVKSDLELRFTNNQGRLIEDYVREFPELADSSGPPCDLIHEEYHIRKSLGHPVVPADYFGRFPGRRDELSRLLGIEGSAPTASFGTVDRANITLKEGDQIDDFELLAVLGSGAFANVYLARQRSISRLVALKVSSDRGQEAKTLAQLDHPNIVRIYDQRRLEERRLRLVYMQLASGGTLSEVIEVIRNVPCNQRTGQHLVDVIAEAGERCGLGPMADPMTLRSLAQLSWPEVVCRIGAQLANALDYAHRQGVLHRDVKPANILLGADGTPKLADFNISAITSRPDVSAAAYFGGSLVYMSPEHLEAFNPTHNRQAEDLDGRADLYSLAVVLWELLTGSRPFRDMKLSESETPSVTLGRMAERRQKMELEHPGDPGDECSRGVLDVIERALLPNREDRPQSGAEFARELTICAQKESRHLVRIPKTGWRDWVRRYPIVAVLIVVTIPNLISAIFNALYNYVSIVGMIVEDEQYKAARAAFFLVMIIINNVAFPLGAFIVCRYVWPLKNVLKRPEKLKATTIDQLQALRVRALRLGSYAAAVGIIEWGLSGIIYPASMRLAGAPLDTPDYPHFVTSFVLCGLVAGAYPFLGVTFLSLRVLFPALLQRNAIDPGAEHELTRVATKSTLYLMIACGVPIIGSVLAVMFQPSHFPNREILGLDLETWHKAFLGTLMLSSLGGLFSAFMAYSVIRRDLSSLAPILRPTDSFGLESTRKL